jgi:integrase
VSIKRRDTNSRGVAYADGKAHWEVRLRRPDGRQYGKTFATRKAAEAWERGQLTAQVTGGWVEPNAGKVPFRERAATYVTDRPKALAPKTVELYRKQLDQLILPTFGAVPVSSITTESVRAWLAKVRTESSALQAAKAYRLLRAILNVAVSDGLIVRNPCNIRGAGQEHSAERPLASAEEIHKLADAMQPRMRLAVLLAGFAGLRRGELFGLQRGDIDLDAATLSVRRQIVYLKDGSRLQTKPKSAAGVRTVSLPPFVLDAVIAHLAEFTPEEATSHVFIGKLGAPLGQVSLQADFERARKATGVTQYTLHDLRHAAGTMAAWTGATTKELMARLGHSTPQASIRYQHAARTRDEEIARRLDVFRPTATEHVDHNNEVVA